MKKRKTKKIKVIRRVVIKGCTKDFGLGIGVLGEQEILFEKKDVDRIAAQLAMSADTFVKEFIEVTYEELL